MAKAQRRATKASKTKGANKAAKRDSKLLFAPFANYCASSSPTSASRCSLRQPPPSPTIFEMSSSSGGAGWTDGWVFDGCARPSGPRLHTDTLHFAYATTRVANAVRSVSDGASGALSQSILRLSVVPAYNANAAPASVRARCLPRS